MTIKMSDQADNAARDTPPWIEVERVLDVVLERNPTSWPFVLSDACRGNHRLQRSVAALLGRRDRITSFMQRPLLPDLPRLIEIVADEGRPLAGRNVGPYQLIREIGRGGMGSVWLGTRSTRRGEQRVAVKILHDCLTSGEIERQFALERRVLASLDHPNIARLVDGGATDDGRLCLIMEHVDGRPIDAFCADRALSLRERVALFLVVVRALEYAHERGVVHRDIKPSNILVTDAGDVKLVDFGVARLLGESTDATGPSTPGRHSRWMTLSYAAPEQLRGDEVTPRTDIYQLGIVLSELLAGFPPEPRLNAIILTALRQKRADYVSAAAFADDLERYVALRTLPLVARLARFITSVGREVRSALGTGSTT